MVVDKRDQIMEEASKAALKKYLHIGNRNTNKEIRGCACLCIGDQNSGPDETSGRHESRNSINMSDNPE